MNVKQKILKFLIENKEKTFSIRELSKVLKMDYKLTYINIKKLYNEKSIKVENFRSQRRCSFADNFNEDVFIVENERKLEAIKKKEFGGIYNYLKEINGQFILLLFGSHVRGNATKNSDIDLLLISPKENVKAVEEALTTLPFDIHLTPITYESFIQMLKSKELSVVSEAIKKNIILFSIEDYYRLLQNAK